MSKLDKITYRLEEIESELGDEPNSFPFDSTVWGTLGSLHKQAVNKADFFKLVNEKNRLQSRLGDLEKQYSELLRFLKVEFFEERVVRGHMGVTTRGYRKVTK